MALSLSFYSNSMLETETANFRALWIYFKFIYYKMIKKASKNLPNYVDLLIGYNNNSRVFET